MIDYHFKCPDCTYHAIHWRDLRRHKNTMHIPLKPCNECIFKGRSDRDLEQHIRHKHNSGSEIDSNGQHETPNSQGDNPPQAPNVISHRTRVFSASRYASTTCIVEPRSQDVFRP